MGFLAHATFDGEMPFHGYVCSLLLLLAYSPLLFLVHASTPHELGLAGSPAVTALAVMLPNNPAGGISSTLTTPYCLHTNLPLHELASLALLSRAEQFQKLVLKLKHRHL